MGLRGVLGRLIAGSSRRDDVESIYRRSWRFAVAYLTVKQKAGSAPLSIFGLSSEDLATDCIADLFERDDAGRFVQLKRYFEQIGWQDLQEEVLFIALRRLVFSKVNEALLRHYRDADPTLSRIIRNLKDGIRKSTQVKLVLKGHRQWIVAGDEHGPRAWLPGVPPEILEAHVSRGIVSDPNTGQVLRAFVRFVAEHPQYANTFPLESFAQMIRAAFGRLAASEHAAQQDDPDRLPARATEGELAAAIDAVVAQVRCRMHGSYVGRGKVDEDTFAVYLQTVQGILRSQIDDEDDRRSRYFEYFQPFRPGMSEETYQRLHRNRLEYLLKLCRNELLRQLQ